MTREEQITNEANIRYSGRISGTNDLAVIHASGLFEGFHDGAQWADQHPVNPWHDASKELPKVDERHKYVLVVVARPDNRVHFACYSHAGFFVNESFYGEFEINDVKYWMQIPELPKED